MTKTNLGRICFVPRGTYSASESYKRLDVVSSPDNGISYVAIADSTGAALTDETKWQVMVDNSAAIRQLKDDVAAITPDDTTVNGKPWTSKNTVDSLCMPLEATGNPVQVCPVEGYPLGVKVSWEPVQEGEGDPSPDNIRPISGRDAVKLTRCGKNLFSTKNAIESSTASITNATIEDNRIVLSKSDGDKWLAYRAGFDIPAGTYTVSLQATCSDEAYTPVFSIYYKNKDTGINKAIGSINGTGAKTIEVPDGKFVSFYAHLSTDASYTGERTVEYSNIQIELGSTATPYEPYTGSTTDISLPETVYGGEVDAVSGVNNRTWRTITLTGEEASHIYDNLFYLDLYKDSSFVQEKAASLISGKSSHYKYYVYSVGCIGVVPDGGSVVYSGNGKYPISNEGIQEWKAYLAAQYAAGTPVQVCYKLAEPVPFTATGTQPIAALSGVNTLYTDAGTLTVTGREDPRHTIVTLTDRIAALESAAAGV